MGSAALATVGQHADLARRVALLAPGAAALPLAPCFVSGASALLALQRYTDARRNAARALWQFELTLQLLQAYRAARLERTALRAFGTAFEVEALEPRVRYDLGAIAEARDEPAVALRYWRDLPAPPGVYEGEWLVRLARQRWRLAPEDPGVAQLGRFYSAHPRLPAAVVEAAARYAEELGASGESVAARRLLEALTPHAASAHSHRFVMSLGSGYERAGDLVLAAESYLHAALAGNDRADTDAVVAGLPAGMALARAGYARDARAQLQWVLTHARDSARIETARRALQELQP